MKKLSVLAAIFAIFPMFATAADTSKPSDLHLNIRRIGLDITKTSIGNPAAYRDSPIQQLNSSDQEYLKGVFDTVLEYKHDSFTWNNGLYMDYGRTKLSPYDKVATITENTDIILLSSDFSYKLWEYEGFKFGPIGRGQYQTEFTANGDIPRLQVLRANAGLAVFDHPIVKELYLTGVYEYDFTYSNDRISKTAAEFGWRLEYLLREGVKFSTNGYYREYLSYSAYLGTDLVRDFSGILRMDVNVWNNLNMGPYIQYRRALARETDLYGSNLIFGLSFSYIKDFNLR